MRVTTFTAVAAALAALTVPILAHAGCGCKKPAPIRRSIQPQISYSGGKVTVVDPRLESRKKYTVVFVSVADGTSGWVGGKAVSRKDATTMTDSASKKAARSLQMRVAVPPLALGPCRVRVFNVSQGKTVNGQLQFAGPPLFEVGESALTITNAPIPLRDVATTLTRSNFKAGVGTDGTMYVAVDVSQVTGATTFRGQADLSFVFTPADIVMFNSQGFTMQRLPVEEEGTLFRIDPPTTGMSARLNYWRHSFAAYKLMHQQQFGKHTDKDPDWHDDGTAHVDHDKIFVAVTAMLDGRRLAPGSTKPFTLTVTSTPATSPN
jgi:hypothetical protein